MPFIAAYIKHVSFLWDMNDDYAKCNNYHERYSSLLDVVKGSSTTPKACFAESETHRITSTLSSFTRESSTRNLVVPQWLACLG